MPIRRRSSITCQKLSPIVHLWLLRLLVPLGCQRVFIDRHDFRDNAVADIVGLGDWIDSEFREFKPKAVRLELRQIHKDAEQKWRDAELPSSLRGNIARLSKLVGLSDTDCRILEFAAMIQNEQVLNDAADWLGQLSSVKMFHALSVLLAIPESAIRSSLSAQSLSLIHISEPTRPY